MKLRYWVPSILWMALVFVLSTDLFSASHTGPLLEVLIRWLFPGLSPFRIDELHHIVRKAAHVTVYAFLAVFYTMGLSSSFRPRWSWSGKKGLQAVGLAFLYACTDEWHQSFSFNRTSSPFDVGYDLLGAALVYAYFNWRYRLRDGRSSGT